MGRVAASCTALTAAAALATSAGQGLRVQQRWTVVKNSRVPVMADKAASKNGIRGGFEGGQYFRLGDSGVYHYFATEMVNTGAQLWAGTSGGHWTAQDPSAPDGTSSGWQRRSTLFISSGVFDGSDRAGAKWAPMINYGWSAENQSSVFTLWYVSYRTGQLPNSSAAGHWANWDGQVRRMVSTVGGNSTNEAALSGPYVDVGVVLDTEQADAAAFEGLQGDDSVNCYQLDNGTWVMFFGTTLDACADGTSPRRGCARAKFQRQGRTVAFAASERLGGPWRRLQMQVITQ
jgi:hypothetical protein